MRLRLFDELSMGAVEQHGFDYQSHDRLSRQDRKDASGKTPARIWVGCDVGIVFLSFLK
jgi:hypothetical protein